MKTDNELIAEFMGLPLTKMEPMFSGSRGMKMVPFQNWKYHSSWDWLMPVVEKIQFFAQVKIENTQCIISVNGDCVALVHSGSNIENVFRACVEFIKWYNKYKGLTPNDSPDKTPHT